MFTEGNAKEQAVLADLRQKLIDFPHCSVVHNYPCCYEGDTDEDGRRVCLCFQFGLRLRFNCLGNVRLTGFDEFENSFYELLKAHVDAEFPIVHETVDALRVRFLVGFSCCCSFTHRAAA